MAKIRFKSIFDRMLFLQCVTVLSLLLILGLGIGFVSRMQSLSMEKSILAEKGQQAARVLEAGGDQEDLRSLTEERKLLIQVLYPEETISAYSDEKWTPLVELPREKTRAADALRRSGTVPEAMERYFAGAKLPTYTVFVRLGDGDKTSVLLIHSDISRWNESFRQLALWTLAICVVAAFVVLFSSYYTAKRIINPFVDMNHIVQCYSKGDFSQRIPVQGKDEASQLGRSFNEMADQLKNLEVTRQSFVANVSHELRSPLTSMKGFLEAMMDGTIPPEEHDHYIDIVLSETRRMTAMVNDLLDLARIESGIITVNYEVFDINELVRRTLITFEARISEKQMELDVRFANEQSFVYADSNQISQVLRNLIDNAIKYSPEGRTLLVSTYALRKEVYVTIRDTGVGIPAEDVPHIFDRFYKVEKAHTPSPQVGSGLGLAIVKKIIEAHGQSITVKSARGKGTQFTFTLEKANTLKRVTDGGRK
jgi:signal transduction histidine kinase